MKKYLNVRGKLLDCSTPVVMGILNLTPDSFYDGGSITSPDQAVRQAARMIGDGAGIIDLGGQSTRPGAAMISVSQEWERLRGPLAAIRKEFPEAVISIDTFHAEIARLAVAAGADMINDVSGGSLDPGMFHTMAQLKIPYVLMHMKGTPQTMQQLAAYDQVVNEVMDYFAARTRQLVSLGITDLVIDPGFGFAKNTSQNFSILTHLELMRFFERPLMVGVSRKSMISKVLEIKTSDALNGTTVLNTVALLKHANILRVHDVKEAAEAIKLAALITA